MVAGGETVVANGRTDTVELLLHGATSWVSGPALPRSALWGEWFAKIKFLGITVQRYFSES